MGLNKGLTYLWGVLGENRLGSFREILESSHSHDGAPRNVEFRGVKDESGATMDTITRFVYMNDENRFDRKFRYDDKGHMHITEEKRRSVLHNLKRTNEKSKLDAIIINDLDKGAINKNLVEAVAEFANEERIPLFVDPQKNSRKIRANPRDRNFAEFI